MSISSEITRINGNIADAYDAVGVKGGTLPSARNSANLPAAIESIPSGKPEQSKTLTLGAAAPSTVTPDSGKVLSSVPVVLDTSVIKAENIKKDVQMLGVTGTHEGGGGGYIPGTVSFFSGQQYEIGYSVPVGVYTFEELLLAAGLSSTQLQGCTLKNDQYVSIDIQCPIANYQNGELDGFRLEGFNFIRSSDTPLLANVVGQVWFSGCGIQGLRDNLIITDNNCSGLVRFDNCYEF